MSANVETVSRIFELFRATDAARIKAELGAEFHEGAAGLGDLGKVLEDTISPEVVVDMSGLSAQMLEGRARYQGYEGWVEFWGAWLEPWEDFDYEHGEFDARGEHVVVETLIKAKGRESGVPVEWRMHQVYTFRDGRIVGLTAFDSREEALAHASAD